MSKKDDIIKTAAALIQTRGYAGTGLNEIIEKSGAPRGSVYYYFKNGKDEIAAAALEYYSINLLKNLQTAASSAGSPEQFVEAVFSFFKKEAVKSGFEKSCPVASTALEISPSNQFLHKTIQNIYRSWQKAVEEALPGCRKDPELAVNFVSLLEGSLVSARIMKSAAPIESAKNAALRSFT